MLLIDQFPAVICVRLDHLPPQTFQLCWIVLPWPWPFVRWIICSNLGLYIFCSGDKIKYFKVKSLRLTSVNLSSHCRLSVLHSSNTTTISELFPHFEVNACHPGCLILLFLSVFSPICHWNSLHNSHIAWGWTTLLVCDETELKPDQICSKAHLWLVYEAWNWTSWCCLHTYTCPDWKYRL